MCLDYPSTIRDLSATGPLFLKPCRERRNHRAMYYHMPMLANTVQYELVFGKDRDPPWPVL